MDAVRTMYAEDTTQVLVIDRYSYTVLAISNTPLLVLVPVLALYASTGTAPVLALSRYFTSTCTVLALH